MREFVPIDIYKSSQERMIEQGLTPAVANRIWMHKALWLICMHKEDIKKVNIALCFSVPFFRRYLGHLDHCYNWFINTRNIHINLQLLFSCVCIYCTIDSPGGFPR